MKPYRTAVAVGSILEVFAIINSSIGRGAFVFGGEFLILPFIILSVYIYRSSKEDNKNGK